MRIGIDIDDTITNTWDTLKPYFINKFGMLNDSRCYYDSVREWYSLNEYFDMASDIYNNVTLRIPLKNDAAYVLKEIHDMGHDIILITSRGMGFYDPYEVTKNYLSINDIVYDKLIVNATDKSVVCLDERIDLFIDNSVKHCNSVSKLGIDVIMMQDNYNKDSKGFVKARNWKDVYKYVKNR